jgi:hypothetical protein
MIHPSSFFNLDLLPEEIFGTEEVPEYILSDSSAKEEGATPEQTTNHQLRHRIRYLEHNLRNITAHCSAERERRMSFNKLFPSLDVSDRYNNLKASWDSLMEAASHGNPRSFYVAVTVALEQVKREELKRKNVESKE